MLLESTPLEELPLEARDEQQRHAAGKPSPVDVVINILKDLAEFQRTSSKQALRDAMREALRESLLQAVRHPGTHPIDIDPVVEYLKERGVIRSGSKRTKRNSAETADRSKRRRASFP